MKIKQFTAVIMAALVIASFSGCGKSAKNNNIASPVTLLDTSDMFSSKDLEVGYDESEVTQITLNGSSANVEGSGASVSGSTVTVSKEGTYLFSGTLDNGAIIVDADDKAKVRLIFDGVTVNCDTSAALYVKQADKVFVTLAKGSENTLSNAKDFVAFDDNDIDAVVYSKDDLTFNGSGSLTVTAKYGHGIVSKDDLVIAGGTYSITSEKKGLSANDSIRVADGDVTVNAGTDALHAENTDDASLGYIYIADGTFNLTSGTDGMDASGAIQIDNGTFTITTGGGSSNASTKQDGSFNADWGQWGGQFGGDGQNGNMRGGKGKGMSADSTELPVTQTSAVSGAARATATTTDSGSAKGIKSDSSVAVNNGSLTINSSDDAIHSNNAVTVAGGTLEITSGDDGIHADANLAISGGTVNITKSYEGIEGMSIAISGGNVSVTSSDDGLNAAGGNDQSSMNGRPGQNEFAAQDGVSIDISGGVLNVNASGDGIDSNGSLSVSGGEVYVSGSTNNGNAALDFNGEATITGGTVIAAGMSGMAQNFDGNSTQGSMLVAVSNQSADGTVTLKDSSGKTLASYTPTKAYNCVVISTPDVKKGATYTVQTGSASTSVTMDSLVVGGGNGMGGMGRGGMGGGMDGAPGNGNPGGGQRGHRGRSGDSTDNSQNSMPGGSQNGMPGNSQNSMPDGSQNGMPGGSRNGMPGGSQNVMPGGSRNSFPNNTQDSGNTRLSSAEGTHL